MTDSPARAKRPTFSHKLEFLSVRFGQFLMGRLPRCLRMPLAQLLTFLWFYALPIRKRLVLNNLKIAFPERDGAWRRRVAWKTHIHFVYMMGFESAAIRRRGKLAIEDLLEFEDEHQALASQLKSGPCIVLSAHFGNWELPTSYLSAFHELRVKAVAKPQHNPLVEEAISRGRRSFGWDIISTRNESLRDIIRTIRNGETLAMLADQDARHDGVFVPFFGRDASTPAGPATLAYRFKIPIVMLFCTRCWATGRYRLKTYPPIQADPSADRKSEIERMTREHVARLEAAVREAPEQYFWFHNRWKTSPKKNG